MTSFLPAGCGFVGQTLHDVVDAAWCEARIAEFEQRSFASMARAYPPSYRDNDRLVFDDVALAEWLFARVRERLPAEVHEAGESWRLVGLNERFRACRYRQGQAFAVHRDGAWASSSERRSRFTLQLYLNDSTAFSGGRTRFYAHQDQAREWASILPRQGLGIVFDHRLWHDGEAVTDGTKYVLRTDVLYERRAGEPLAVDADVVSRHTGYVWQILVRRDGSVVSAGRDGLLRVARGTTPSRQFDLREGSVVALAEDSTGVLWCGTRSGRIGRVTEAGLHWLPTQLDGVLSLAALCDGPVAVAAGTSAGEIVLFDGSGVELKRVRAHQGWVWAVAPYQGGVVSVGADGEVRWLGVGEFANYSRVLANYARACRAVCVEANGGLLVGDAQGTVHLVAARAQVTAHAAAITRLVSLPDGCWASTSEDARLRVWRGSRLVRQWQASDFTTTVALGAPDELLWSGYDGVVRRAQLGRLTHALSESKA